MHTCAKSRNLEACYLPAADPEIRQHIDICCLGPYTLDLSFQKANVSKHFLISDCSMTSFHTVSALTF